VSLKRLGVTTCAFLVAIGVSAAAASAGTASVTSKSVTFHLVERQIGFNYIDNPPRQGMNAPPLIGDEFAFTSNLQTKSGAHAGLLEATCMIARGGIHAQGPCYGAFLLKGGTLMAMAVNSLSGNAPTQIVIVGGTGVYQGVTGSVVSVSRGQNSPFSDDTFTLNWN
jgi:hypothetical protein